MAKQAHKRSRARARAHTRPRRTWGVRVDWVGGGGGGGGEYVLKTSLKAGLEEAVIAKEREFKMCAAETLLLVKG